MRRTAPALVAGALLLAGCSGSGDTGRTPTPDPTPSPTAAFAWPSPSSAPARAFDRALHDELVAMMARDQGAPGAGDAAGETAEDRIARLKEIIDTHGWPGTDLVGEDGEDAAWVIAQHADDDPDFQASSLELLRDAVAAGVGSPGNLAYLTDRVAVGAGEPQVFGTQMGCTDGGPVPATPIVDEGAVEALRARAGLDPLADYRAEMAGICAQDLPED